MATIFAYLKMLLAFLFAIVRLLGFGADTAEVELYANPASGYYWEYSYDEYGVLMLANSHYLPDTSAIFSGGGGTQKFTFREIGEGTVNITFEYTQVGTKNVASRYVYTYQVDEDGEITLLNVE